MVVGGGVPPVQFDGPAPWPIASSSFPAAFRAIATRRQAKELSGFQGIRREGVPRRFLRPFGPGGSHQQQPVGEDRQQPVIVGDAPDRPLQERDRLVVGEEFAQVQDEARVGVAPGEQGRVAGDLLAGVRSASICRASDRLSSSASKTSRSARE